MKHRAIALLLVLAMLTALLTGCGGANKDTADTTQSADTAETAEDAAQSADTAQSAEPLTLTDEIRADPVAYVTDGAIHMGDKVMTVDGNEVNAGAFFYLLAYLYYQSSSMYANYGITLDVTQTVSEDSEVTIAEDMLRQTKEDVQRHVLLRTHADTLGLTLSEEQENNLTALKDYITDQVALFYVSTLEDMLSTNRASLMSGQIKEYYFGENGTEAPTDDTLKDYAEEHGHYTCRYILLRTDDLAADDTDGKAAQQAKAQELYDQVKDLAGEKLLTTFTELQTQHNADGNTEPFSFDENTSLVPGFREKVAELAHGEVGLTEETNYGYFVVLRLEPDLSKVRESYSLERYDALIAQWLSESSVQTTDALDALDMPACLNRLQALQNAVLAELSAEAEAQTEADTAATEAATEAAETTTEAE